MAQTIDVTINGTTYTVEVGDVNASPVEVVVNGERKTVTWQEAQAAPAAPQAAPAVPRRPRAACGARAGLWCQSRRPQRGYRPQDHRRGTGERTDAPARCSRCASTLEIRSRRATPSHPEAMKMEMDPSAPRHLGP